MSTPQLHLQTLFLLDGDGRIIGTCEPEPDPGDLFCLIRGNVDCVWAVGSDVPQDVSDELNCLAREEPPVSDFRDAPVHAERYMSLVEGRVDSGPAFVFPEEIARPHGTVFIQYLQSLGHHFSEWTASEIPHRTPVVAFLEEGCAVSVCFCSRRTQEAAECGIETAVEFRGRGFGPRVTAGWALAIRASGRVPLYSTSWSNNASLAVTRKLALVTYASKWSIS